MDAPSDSRAARIWKFSSVLPSSASTTMNPRWLSPMTRPSTPAARSALLHRRLADLKALRQVALAQLLTRGELTGNDQLADQRRHHVGLADVSRPGFPGRRADHRNRSHVRLSAFVVGVLAGCPRRRFRHGPHPAGCRSGSALTSWVTAQRVAHIVGQ